MKKYILGTILSLGLLASPAFVPQAEAAGLTPVQISAIVSLLQTLGVDQSVVDTIQAALSGGSTTPSGTSPTALITVNGQPSVTNADPLVPRTWTWSGTPGATYTASGYITGCENASQNGPQSNWTPWTDTRATGTASSGSTSIIPGAVKYGCVITGTYNVTKNGNTTTSNATITYKHANGSANPLPVVTGTPGVPQASFAVGEHPVPGQPPENDFPLGFSGDTNVSCSLVSGQLPSGVEIKSRNDGYGCFIAGVVGGPVGVYKITWKGEGMLNGVFKSSTSNLEITVYVPDKTIRLLTNGFPVATVGEPYSATLRVETTGNWTGSKISFELRWGLGGNPGGPLFSNSLGLWDIYNNSVQTITTPEPTNAQKTAVISGTPSKAGTYQLLYCAGNGTEHHAAFCKEDYMPFIVKSRIQTPADLNAAIVSAMNSLNWSSAHSVQSATSFKATMQQEGWTLGDVATATGYKESDLVNTLYPVAAGGDSRAPDAIARYDTIRFLIQSYVQTFDWSAANKQQSAISFKALMDQKGWTSRDVQTSFPLTLGSPDPILTEILKAYVSGATTPQMNLVASVSNLDSGPFVENGTVVNNKPVYVRIVGAGLKTNPPQGCMQPVGSSGCQTNAYRDYLPSEWLDNSTIQTVVQDPSIYPLTTYELYIKFPGGSPIKAGSFTLLSGANNVSTVPHLTTLSPSSSTVETTIIINGSGFTGTNNIYMDNILIDPATVSSSGGLTPTWISFVVPSKLPSCPGSDRFCTPGPALTPGTHSVFAQNTNGTSNTVSLGVN